MSLGTSRPQYTSSPPVRRRTKRCVHKFRQGDCKICDKKSPEITKNKLETISRPHGKAVQNGIWNSGSRHDMTQSFCNSGARLVKDHNAAGFCLERAWDQTYHMKSEIVDITSNHQPVTGANRIHDVLSAQPFIHTHVHSEKCIKIELSVTGISNIPDPRNAENHYNLLWEKALDWPLTELSPIKVDHGASWIFFNGRNSSHNGFESKTVYERLCQAFVKCDYHVSDSGNAPIPLRDLGQKRLQDVRKSSLYLTFAYSNYIEESERAAGKHFGVRKLKSAAQARQFFEKAHQDDDELKSDQIMEWNDFGLHGKQKSYHPIGGVPSPRRARASLIQLHSREKEYLDRMGPYARVAVCRQSGIPLHGAREARYHFQEAHGRIKTDNASQFHGRQDHGRHPVHHLSMHTCDSESARNHMHTCIGTLGLHNRRTLPKHQLGLRKCDGKAARNHMHTCSQRKVGNSPHTSTTQKESRQHHLGINHAHPAFVKQRLESHHTSASRNVAWRQQRKPTKRVQHPLGLHKSNVHAGAAKQSLHNAHQMHREKSHHIEMHKPDMSHKIQYHPLDLHKSKINAPAARKSLHAAHGALRSQSYHATIHKPGERRKTEYHILGLHKPHINAKAAQQALHNAHWSLRNKISRPALQEPMRGHGVKLYPLGLHKQHMNQKNAKFALHQHHRVHQLANPHEYRAISGRPGHTHLVEHLTIGAAAHTAHDGHRLLSTLNQEAQKIEHSLVMGSKEGVHKCDQLLHQLEQHEKLLKQELHKDIGNGEHLGHRLLSGLEELEHSAIRDLEHVARAGVHDIALIAHRIEDFHQETEKVLINMVKEGWPDGDMLLGKLHAMEHHAAKTVARLTREGIFDAEKFAKHGFEDVNALTKALIPGLAKTEAKITKDIHAVENAINHSSAAALVRFVEKEGSHVAGKVEAELKRGAHHLEVDGRHLVGHVGAELQKEEQRLGRAVHQVESEGRHLTKAIEMDLHKDEQDLKRGLNLTAGESHHMVDDAAKEIMKGERGVKHAEHLAEVECRHMANRAGRDLERSKQSLEKGAHSAERDGHRMANHAGRDFEIMKQNLHRDEHLAEAEGHRLVSGAARDLEKGKQDIPRGRHLAEAQGHHLVEQAGRELEKGKRVLKRDSHLMDGESQHLVKDLDREIDSAGQQIDQGIHSARDGGHQLVADGRRDVQAAVRGAREVVDHALRNGDDLIESKNRHKKAFASRVNEADHAMISGAENVSGHMVRSADGWTTDGNHRDTQEREDDNWRPAKVAISSSQKRFEMRTTEGCDHNVRSEKVPRIGKAVEHYIRVLEHFRLYEASSQTKHHDATAGVLSNDIADRKDGVTGSQQFGRRYQSSAHTIIDQNRACEVYASMVLEVSRKYEASTSTHAKERLREGKVLVMISKVKEPDPARRSYETEMRKYTLEFDQKEYSGTSFSFTVERSAGDPVCAEERCETVEEYQSSSAHLEAHSSIKSVHNVEVARQHYESFLRKLREIAIKGQNGAEKPKIARSSPTYWPQIWQSGAHAVGDLVVAGHQFETLARGHVADERISSNSLARDGEKCDFSSGNGNQSRREDHPAASSLLEHHIESLERKGSRLMRRARSAKKKLSPETLQPFKPGHERVPSATRFPVRAPVTPDRQTTRAGTSPSPSKQRPWKSGTPKMRGDQLQHQVTSQGSPLKQDPQRMPLTPMEPGSQSHHADANSEHSRTSTKAHTNEPPKSSVGDFNQRDRENALKGDSEPLLGLHRTKTRVLHDETDARIRAEALQHRKEVEERLQRIKERTSINTPEDPDHEVGPANNRHPRNQNTREDLTAGQHGEGMHHDSFQNSQDIAPHYDDELDEQPRRTSHQSPRPDEKQTSEAQPEQQQVKVGKVEHDAFLRWREKQATTTNCSMVTRPLAPSAAAKPSPPAATASSATAGIPTSALDTLHYFAGTSSTGPSAAPELLPYAYAGILARSLNVNADVNLRPEGAGWTPEHTGAAFHLLMRGGIVLMRNYLGLEDNEGSRRMREVHERNGVYDYLRESTEGE